jgi:Peptidase C13 family
MPPHEAMIGEQGMEGGGWAAWLAEGVRTAVFRAPRVHRLQAPWRTMVLRLVLLFAATVALWVGGQRLMVGGDAEFYARALQQGWWITVAAIGLCALAAAAAWGKPPRPSAADLLALLLLQQLLIDCFGYLWWIVLGGWPTWLAALGPWAAWITAMLPVFWLAVAQALLLARTVRPRAQRLGMALMSLGLTAAAVAWPPDPLWVPRPDEAAAASFERERRWLTPEALDAQPTLLPAALAALAPQRPGVIDVYSITFAPYADEDVFRRESEMVDGVMRERFGAQGRSVQLVNHRSTPATLPWATRRNLEAAIRVMAAQMDPREDLLFIHLTSHGGREGVLASAFDPLALDALDAAGLRRMLDDAGVQQRVLSVSACFSGSWIPALQSPTTLVITAADAQHTSYGCGRGSPLTYFGRAMYDEALRHTHSFVDAHATARGVIEKREQEAGKSDGYSNPQIVVGEAIREPLARLAAQQNALPTIPQPKSSAP